MGVVQLQRSSRGWSGGATRPRDPAERHGKSKPREESRRRPRCSWIAKSFDVIINPTGADASESRHSLEGNARDRPAYGNFFRDRAVQADPYPYFDAVRSQAPVWQEPHYGVFMVTGSDAALAVYNDSAQFSSCNTVRGPFVKFPEPFEGADVTDLIERHRDMPPFTAQPPAFAPPRHPPHRPHQTK